MDQRGKRAEARAARNIMRTEKEGDGNVWENVEKIRE